MSLAVAAGRRRLGARAPIDFALLLCVLGLIGLGLVMVASASMPLADRTFGDPFFYLTRQAIALGLALAAGILAFALPLSWWQRSGGILFLVGLALLVLVLVPGVGHTVNGATRWIPLGPFNLQSAEFMKLFAIVYISGYLVRHREAVLNSVHGFVRPMLLMVLAGTLIMIQPDFGTVAVMMAVVLGLMFLSGVQARYFLLLVVLVGIAFVALIILEPYRVERVLYFRNPFEHAFDGGYQLTQALIAFGRGEWFGVGLGNGIQKQFFLPEPHTDFIAAVIGEELGLAGILVLIGAFAFVTWRAFAIGARAIAEDEWFAAYLAHGIGLSIGLQAFVNLGVSLGLLPTKGLTLPFISYGSNSLIVSAMAVGLLLSIDRGQRQRAALEAGSGKRQRWVRV
ncbi:putative lipid II flippase FtsW [Thioalkalicoccus limnaeus]|uniref:Probable peptidoglycan glycosyltransferase FtsW n=1 Tax=Thioalkalicoccus limnaeus TaxID=120681 RepID=A0ABV4BBH0_9GAMM